MPDSFSERTSPTSDKYSSGMHISRYQEPSTGEGHKHVSTHKEIKYEQKNESQILLLCDLVMIFKYFSDVCMRPHSNNTGKSSKFVLHILSIKCYILI